MSWPRPTQRVLIVLAAVLLALGALLGGRAATRPAAIAVLDDPSLDLRLDVNRATAAELESLPGVGPLLAGRIVAHRSTQGTFRSISELKQVPGFGEKLVNALQPLVFVR